MFKNTKFTFICEIIPPWKPRAGILYQSAQWLGYKTADRQIVVRFPAGGRGFFCSRERPDLSNGDGGLLPDGKEWSWPPSRNAEVKNNWSNISTPYAFRAWYLISKPKILSTEHVHGTWLSMAYAALHKTWPHCTATTHPTLTPLNAHCFLVRSIPLCVTEPYYAVK
jgi:hypothetical protein